MSGAQTRETRSLVAPTRLDTNETVLNLLPSAYAQSHIHKTDNVDTTNTVAAGNSVGSQKEVNSIGSHLLLAALGVFELDGETLFKVNGKVLGLVGGSERVHGKLPHVGRRGDVRVLQDTGLVRAVSQVLVHTPGLGLGGGHGNALLTSVGEEIVTTGEALVEDRVTPGSNDLDVGLEGVKGEFEPDLVVTLASAAVGNGETSFPLLYVSLRRRETGYAHLGDIDLGAGNHWTSQRGTQEVDVLVDGVAGNGGEAELLNKLPCHRSISSNPAIYQLLQATYGGGRQSQL